MKFISLIFTLSIASLVVASPGRHATKDQPEETSEASGGDVVPSARAQFVMPKLYDFATYRQKYNKNYEDPAELAWRTKLYIARVCTIFMSAIMYKRGLSSKYLKIGPFTDWTDEERSVITKDSPVSSMANESDDLVAVTEDIDQLRVNHRRSKRSAPGESSSNSSLSIRTNHSEQFKRSRKGSFVRSLLMPITKRLGNFSPIQRYRNYTSNLYKVPEDDERVKLPDGVSLNHAANGCFSPVRDQRDCGSCYAYATIAIIEYLYCRQEGKLVHFSEQYLIHCGPLKSKRLKGCDGGRSYDAIKFITKYGLEEAAAYTRAAKGQTCAYPEGFKSEYMGKIKLVDAELHTIKRKSKITKDKILNMLTKEGPLFFSLIAYEGFVDYGGGVDMFECDPSREDGHAMVLVGHGIENGREYWLIRNSFGRGFGEKGYYKLDKRISVDCIDWVGYLEGYFVKNELHETGQSLMRPFKKPSQVASRPNQIR